MINEKLPLVRLTCLIELEFIENIESFFKNQNAIDCNWFQFQILLNHGKTI